MVGGYNPLDWSGNKIFKGTTENFIFNISNRNNVDTAQLSYVINNDYGHAIYCSPSALPCFGQGYDIYFYSNNNYTGGIGTASSTYNNINIMYGSKFDELEVFQIIDKN